MLHNFCLTKQNILTKKEITQVFNNVEIKFNSSHFLFLLSSNFTDKSGICVILAKKKINKAFKRNLCRRLIKEFFRTQKTLLKGKGLVVIGKETAAGATRENLWQSIKKFQEFLKK